MDRRLRLPLLLPVLLFTGACSQRAPWRVVSAPQPASGDPVTVRAAGPSSAAPADAAPADATMVAHITSLMFPLPNRENTRLEDSFNAPRDGGARTHHAVDIMAPRGTPVLSVQDGRILRLSKNKLGGITVYATDLSETYVYYYAHLDGYYQGLYDGKPLLRGDTLGYVGTTGNAPDNLPHLHFQLMRMPADGKYWRGDPIDPYPLLTRTGVASSGK